MLNILFQDEYYVAIYKPSGLLVHRSKIDGLETRFAVQLLRDQLGKKVYPVHRLDKPTSGILVFAFEKEPLSLLSKLFHENQTEKIYHAIVRGHCPEFLRVDKELKELKDDRLDDKEVLKVQDALTEVFLVQKFLIDVEVDRFPQSRFSLVELKPKTGRRHQLRRHLKHAGYPILGDTRHGNGKYNQFFRNHFHSSKLLLHASRLCFAHPISGEQIKIQASYPERFQNVIHRLNQENILA